MSILFRAATIGVIPFLSACAGFFPDKVTQGASPVSSMEATAIFVGVEADGINTLKSAIKDGGVTGFVGNEDGTISEVLVRLSADGATAYMSVDGGEEVEFPTKGYGYEGSNYGYGRWYNGTDEIYVSYSGDGMDYIADWTDDGFRGRIGLETPSDSLPTGTATYNGSWSAESNADYYEEGYISAYGQIDLNADFDNGGIEGMAIGNYYGDTSGLFAGPIDGTISGSRIAGTAFFEGPDVTAEFDMLGGIYGQNGEQIGGGFAGTISDETGDHSLGGDFSLYIQDDDGFCCDD